MAQMEEDYSPSILDCLFDSMFLNDFWWHRNGLSLTRLAASELRPNLIRHSVPKPLHFLSDTINFLDGGMVD